MKRATVRGNAMWGLTGGWRPRDPRDMSLRRTALLAVFALSACGDATPPFRTPAVDAGVDAPALDLPRDSSNPPDGPVARDIPPAEVATDVVTDVSRDVPRDVQTIDISAPPPSDVEVTITADNAYSFGYGDITSVVTWFPGTRATLAGQIFNCPVGNGPERYLKPAAAAPDGAYLYVVSWDDLSVTQGIIGQFRREGGVPIYTGAATWQVCATGVDFSRSSTGPTQAEVNAQIVHCNEGTGAMDSSRGWVNLAGAVTTGATGTLAVGEPNDTAGGDFPQVCPGAMGGINEAARWMWYQPGGVANPFRSTGRNVFRAFLIFRLGAGDIPGLSRG